MSSSRGPKVMAADADGIAEAVRVLRGGGLVAFPTETVYGLGARGLHAAEVVKIFAAKGRPPGHPLILHVPDAAMAQTLAAVWPTAAAAATAAFWPGPLTVVVPRSERVPAAVSGGLPTVAVRSPRHPVATALLAAVGEPLAAPSANAHTHLSPTTAAHVVESLGSAVDLVLDGGACDVGIESTVLDCTVDPPRILRPGSISLAMLRGVLPTVEYAAAAAVTVAADAPRVSPGLATKHYAPRARTVLTADAAGAVIAERTAAGGAGGTAVKIGILAMRAVDGADEARVLPADADGYAHGMFAALHELDAAGCTVIFIEDVPAADEAWRAVRDRLTRAAATE